MKTKSIKKYSEVNNLKPALLNYSVHVLVYKDTDNDLQVHAISNTNFVSYSLISTHPFITKYWKKQLFSYAIVVYDIHIHSSDVRRLCSCQPFSEISTDIWEIVTSITQL
jgi:hypothetical protein